MRDNLLDQAPPPLAVDAAPATTRRDLIRELGFSAALLVPVITAIEVPLKQSLSTAAEAASCPIHPFSLPTVPLWPLAM